MIIIKPILRGLIETRGDPAVGQNDAFRRAAQDDPAHLNSRFNIGIVLKYDKGDFPGAIHAWEEFLKVAPAEDERVIMVLKEIETMKKSLPTK